jgi:beta-phosphoglucomutase-like phosphatase (HAD superfamily)
MEITTIKDAIHKYLSDKGYNKIDLRTAMFDMDGVLFDSMKNHAYSWHETMKHFGMLLPYEEAYMHEGRTGAGTINIVSKRDRGHEATEEEIKEIYAYKSNIFNTLPEAGRMPGAYELLCKVKQSGITPMVVTGSGQKSLLERLQLNFPDIFHPDLMVTAFDVKYGKPNPEPYLMGIEKANAHFRTNNAHIAPITQSNTIIIENAPLGVQAGVASGCFTVAVNTGPLPDSALLDPGANLLFHSMQELADSWEELLNLLNTTTSI